MIDGGACFGTHSRAFAAKVGSDGKVISFEPSKTNFEILKKNASVVDAANISVFQLALGASEQSAISVEVDPVNAGASRIDLVAAGETSGGLTVRVTTLDGLELDRVNFIKLDLEGAELSALRGSIQTLEKHRPIVFTEVNCVEESAGVFQFMKDQGFYCYGVNSIAFNINNFAASTSDMFSGASENGFLLFMPRVPPNSGHASMH